MNLLDLYYIDLKYIRNLSKVDDNVMSTSPQINKQNRPFVGIVVVMDNKNYCIPITSPKDKFKNKKSAVDFIKIFDDKRKEPDGSSKLIGILNINNMIPIDVSVISKIDLNIHSSDSVSEREYKSLMQKQIKWCRENSDIIQNKANKVYTSVTEMPEKNRNLTRRCCDFAKLEKVLDKYISKSQSTERQAPLSRGKIKANAQKISQKSKSSPSKKKEHDL